MQQPATEQPPIPPQGLHVVVQYYNDANADRQAEYDYCVQCNLANQAVLKVHCMLEPGTVVPDWLRDHPKYVGVPVEGRLTYKRAFEYANEALINQVVCLSNLDIFLDHATKWDDARALLDMSVVFCLSRYEFDGTAVSTRDPGLLRLAFATAQDAWLFKAPIFVKECDFCLGMLGCDNAIAHRLKISGYIPMNKPQEFKVHHYDLARGKTGGNFLQHHKPNPERPEERGVYLVPDFDALDSVDGLLRQMGLGAVPKYRVMCDVLTNYLRITNPTAPTKDATDPAAPAKDANAAKDTVPEVKTTGET